MKKLIYILLLIPVLIMGQGSEKITNGDFSSATGWTTETPVSISGGVASFNGTAAGSLRQANGVMVSGILADTEYTLKFDVFNIVGEARITVMSTNAVTYIASKRYYDNSYEVIFTTPSSVGAGGIRFYSNSGVFDLDNVSLIQTADIGASPYYVAVDGIDAASGTIDDPWGTWQRAFNVAQAGDTVYFRGGVYYSKIANKITNSGTYGNDICYFNYPGEEPILDCIRHGDNMRPNTEGDIYNRAIYFTRQEHLHFKGLTIRNVLQHEWSDTINWLGNTAAIDGYIVANLTFENITVHNIGLKAFYIHSGAYNTWDWNPEIEWVPGFDYDTTRFINVDAYNLCDSLSRGRLGNDAWEGGNHADAFKIESYQGTVYTFDNCRAWNFTDDGWDCNHAGHITWTNCWAMAGPDQGMPAFEGNAWKVTALAVDAFYPEELANPNDTVLKKWVRCVATFSETGFANNMYMTYEGYRENNAAFYNNIAYRNNNNFFEFDDRHSGSTEAAVIYRNNIAFGGRYITPCLGVRDDNIEQINIHGRTYRESNNNWDYAVIGSCSRWDYATDIVVTPDDFVNGLDSATIVAQLTAPRQAEGSLPATHPFALASTSNLIDAGTEIPKNDGVNIGLSWCGSSPDIGASEYPKNPNSTSRIKYPSDGSILSESEPINIIIIANNPDGFISSVKLYGNDTTFYEGVIEPWEFTWNDPKAGDYYFRATVTDNNNCHANSPWTNVKIIRGQIIPDNNSCRLYPNPTHDGVFYLRLKEKLPVSSNVHFISNDGKTHYTTNLNKGESFIVFDISHLNSGLYNMFFENSTKYQPCFSQDIKPILLKSIIH